MNHSEQLHILQTLQGSHTGVAGKPVVERYLDTLIMRPRQFELNGTPAITWTVGHLVSQRFRAVYDENQDKLDFEMADDGSVRFSDFVAVPSLGVLAVDDRAGDIHLGGKHAINRFLSMIHMLGDTDAEIIFDANQDEIRRALTAWDLTSFKFTVRPNNPRPVSRLAQALSEQFKIDGIGQLTGVARPNPGTPMKKGDNGFIETAANLVEAGYGQMAVSGVTEDGLDAEIKKPKFEQNREKNERSQAKKRELRVYVESDSPDHFKTMETAGMALIRFYANDD